MFFQKRPRLSCGAGIFKHLQKRRLPESSGRSAFSMARCKAGTSAWTTPSRPLRPCEPSTTAGGGWHNTCTLEGASMLLAPHLYFEGGFIVIDHGLGLMSLYLHLSDFKVKPGDNVVTGQVIATSGGSGRATGPQLHRAVRWQGIYVDPAVVLRLQMPN